MIVDNHEVAKKNINEKQIQDYDYLYSSRKFCEFNKDKCDYIYTHFDSKMSMIFGVKGNDLVAPFSAPFSFIRYASEYIKYSHIYNFFNSLKDDVNNSDIKKIKITLPPTFYNDSIIAKISHSLSYLGFKLEHRDINSHIDLNKIDISTLPSTTKKAIRASNKYKNNIFLAKTTEDKFRAYEIIKDNRNMKGYPLRMTWEQVINTANEVAKADFFIVTTDGVDVAAAIVFEVTKDIVQVVYWGANSIGEKCNVMYYLPFELIKHYKSKQIRYMDIGPSSESGIITYGLNDYKQLIGCINTLKETWVYHK